MSIPTPTQLGSLDYVGSDGLPYAVISFFPASQDQLDNGNADGLPAALAAVTAAPPAVTGRPVIVFMM